VSDIEDLAHAEARDLAFSLTNVDVAGACTSAVRAAGIEGTRRIELQLDESVTARTDETRLRQILVNLLTNADRHTPSEGTITVRATKANQSAVIAVHNSGSSLEPGELDRVFDRFYRVDPSRQRASGGRGLGLAIVKHLVEAQSGTVTAKSDDNGVTFEVTLPAGATIATTHHRPAP